MVFDTIDIEAKLDLPRHTSEKKIQDKAEKYLKNYVDEMIGEADNKLTGHEKQPTLPLIRLRFVFEIILLKVFV